jgi:uncharacterized membrane protein
MEAIGPLLIVLSIPLVLRWVPQNRIYGFRIPPTGRSKSVWYDANALCARHMILLGLLMVVLEFVLPLSVRNQTLRAVAVVGLVSITVMDWRTASRWERERSRGWEAKSVDPPP